MINKSLLMESVLCESDSFHNLSLNLASDIIAGERASWERLETLTGFPKIVLSTTFGYVDILWTEIMAEKYGHKIVFEYNTTQPINGCRAFVAQFGINPIRHSECRMGTKMQQIANYGVLLSLSQGDLIELEYGMDYMFCGLSRKINRVKYESIHKYGLDRS